MPALPGCPPSPCACPMCRNRPMCVPGGPVHLRGGATTQGRPYDLIFIFRYHVGFRWPIVRHPMSVGAGLCACPSRVPAIALRVPDVPEPANVRARWYGAPPRKGDHAGSPVRIDFHLSLSCVILMANRATSNARRGRPVCLPFPGARHRRK